MASRCESSTARQQQRSEANLSDNVFDTVDLQKAKKILQQGQGDDYAPNILFYNYDHWQDMAGWVGPTLPNTDADYSKYSALVKSGFTFANVVKEVIDRHINALLGKEPATPVTVKRKLGKAAVEVGKPATDKPTFGQAKSATPPATIPAKPPVIAPTASPITNEPETDKPLPDKLAPTEQNPDDMPTPEEQSLMDEIEPLWDTWVKRALSGESHFLFDAAKHILLGDHSTLRAMITPELIENGTLPHMEIAEALEHIHVGALNEDSANVWRRPASQRDIGVYVYKQGDGVLEEFGGEDAELCYVDDAGDTVLRQASGSSVTIPLNKTLTMYKVNRPLLVGDSVRSLQRALNMSLTMRKRNVELAGFRERTIINGETPWYIDANGDRVQKSPKVGPGSINYIRGLTSTDAMGNESIVNASVVYGEPVDVSTFDLTDAAYYNRMLAEVHQLHYSIAGDANASGTSRVQAQAAFEADLHHTANCLNAALEWVFDVVVGLASAIAGQPGKYADLRCNAMIAVEPTPIDVEEMRFWSDAAERKQVALSTVQTKIGIEDTTAEQQKLAEQHELDMAHAEEQLAQQAMFAPEPVVGQPGAVGNSKPNGKKEEPSQWTKNKNA